MKINIFFASVFFILSFFFLSIPAHAANFTLDPLDKTVTSGEQFSVNLFLDTEGKTINAVDLVLTYPQSLIWIDQINYPTVFPFHIQNVTKQEGKVIFHFGADSQGNRFNGRTLLATLTLSTHAAGEAYLSFVCDNSDDSDDTNIWEAETANDITDCGDLHKGIYHINPKVGGVVSSPSPSPVCGLPQAPTGLDGRSGEAVGQVTLSWNAVDNADYYTVTYGLVSGGYIYGAPNIGKGTEYTVSQLSAGRLYFFVLTSVNSCGSSGYSSEVAARAGGRLPVPSPVYEEKGGWQPPTVSPTPFLSPSPEGEEPGEATASASPVAEEEEKARESPAAFIPPKKEPFWREWNFWLKAGLLSLVLFVLLLIASALIKKLKGGPPSMVAKKPEEEAGEWPPPAAPSEAEAVSEAQKGEVEEQKPPPFSSKNVEMG